MQVNQDDVRFVHDVTLGCTVAFVVTDSSIVGTAAFAHKKGRGRSSHKPDQFCRKVGRSITLSRLEGTLTGRGTNVPYSFIVKTRDKEVDPFDVHRSIRTAMETIKSIHPDYQYNTSYYESQIYNNSIIDAVLNNVYNTVKDG